MRVRLDQLFHECLIRSTCLLDIETKIIRKSSLGYCSLDVEPARALQLLFQQKHLQRRLWAPEHAAKRLPLIEMWIY